MADSVVTHVIDVDVKDGVKSVGTLESTLKKFGTTVASVFAVKKIYDFGKALTELGRNGEEIMNKYNVVFEGMTKDADAWVESWAGAVGRSKVETKDLLASNTDLLEGFGMTKEEAFEMSKQIIETGTDLASFNNLQDDQAINAVSKAMLGEREALKSLGIALNQTELEKFAEENGMVWKEMNKVEQATLTMNAIIAQSPNALGDAERSAESFTGQQKRLQGQLIDLGTEIGSIFLPYLTQIMVVLNETVIPAIYSFIEWLRQVKEMLMSIPQWIEENQTKLIMLGIVLAAITIAVIAYNASLIATAIGVAALTAAETIATVVKAGLTLATTALGVAMAFLTSPITLVILAIGLLIAAGYYLWKNFDEIKEKAIEVWGTISDWISEKVEQIKNFFSDLWQSVKDIFNSMWTWVNDKVNAIMDKLKSWGNAIKDFFSGIGTAIVDAIKGAINWVIKLVNKFLGGFNSTIGVINKVPGVNIPEIPKIPTLAKGGLAYGPTLAMVGDNRNAGIDPEVIAPLSRLQNMVSSQLQATIKVDMQTAPIELDGEQVSQILMPSMTRLVKLAGGNQ